MDNSAQTSSGASITTGGEENLDICLARATNPFQSEVTANADQINALCAAMSGVTDGSQVALRFLAHKIQSPQEREALQAITVLEQLVNTYCGHQLIEELAKFRFLNELIKVVSPKYLAHRSSPLVKQRVIELMFKWSVEIKQMPKIFEAYQMLKKQGIVTEDPVHILADYKPPTPPPPRPKDEIFDDEENAKLLRTLLATGKPDDLQAANRLIKSLAKEADKRIDFKVRFQTELETVNNNAKVLMDMLQLYSRDSTSAEEKELMKELFESCERLRLRLFKLANDLTDKDTNMDQLLGANDTLTKVINLYKERVLQIDSDSSNDQMPITLLDIASPPHRRTSNYLNDVELLDDHISSLSGDGVNANSSTSSSNYEELGDVFTNSSQLSCNGSDTDTNILLPEPIRPQKNSSKTANSGKASSDGTKMGPKSAFDELNALSDSLIKQNISSANFSKNIMRSKEYLSKVSLSELQQKQLEAGSANNSINRLVISSSASQSSPDESNVFSGITVALESIEPNDATPPITLYDKNNVKVSLHFAKNSTQLCNKSNINVMVITFVSTNKSEVSQIKFLAAVPKSMKVKLQPLSGNTLPPFSPFFSPSAITQIMLIARNASEDKTEKVRLKYKFSYSLSNELNSDVGEIDSLFENFHQS